MTSHIPDTVIVLFPDAGIRWIRGARHIKPLKKTSCIPNPPVHRIPTFDRKELRERVARFLEQYKFQREQLRAAAHGG